MRATHTRTLKYVAVVALVVVAGSFAVRADDDGHFKPGNLVVSISRYHNDPGNVTVGMALPPNCVAPNCVTAQYDGFVSDGLQQRADRR